MKWAIIIYSLLTVPILTNTEYNVGSIPKKQVNTEFSFCSELRRIHAFHPWGYRWEKNNHEGAQQVQSNDNGKTKDKSSRPSWPCEACSPWDSWPELWTKPATLQQMSWHRPNPPGLQLQVVEPVQISSPWPASDNSQSPERGSSHPSWGCGPKKHNCAAHLLAWKY